MDSQFLSKGFLDFLSVGVFLSVVTTRRRSGHPEVLGELIIIHSFTYSQKTLAFSEEAGRQEIRHLISALVEGPALSGR